MTPQILTRQFYNRLPYPPPRDPRSRSWRLPPLEWILSIDRQRLPNPRRVLVSGCGTGGEAFLLKNALPDAAIVAVDFSARSIREAKKGQASSALLKRIQFVEADLTAPGLLHQVGGEFDLIVCHGVLTYIPRPESTLRNLAQCLRPDGILYLDVNGAAHFSANLRPVLTTLGFDISDIPRNQRWRSVIRMWESVEAGTQGGRVTRFPNWYLGSDFFGPLLHNLDLRQWAEIIRRAGLYLRAGFAAHWALRPIVASEATRLFMGCPRAEVCELLDLMHPASFHNLVLTRQPAANPPWKDRAKLLAWRPAHTGLYKISYPRQAGRTDSTSVTVLKSRALGTQFDWPMPKWQAQLLRRCDGAKPIAQLLRETGVPAAQLGEQLFLLYQFAVLNIFPP
jgi:SAM-dependent methyltransferase